MNDVLAYCESEVSTDGSWSRLLRVCGTDDMACSVDYILPFKYHGEDRT